MASGIRFDGHLSIWAYAISDSIRFIKIRDSIQCENICVSCRVVANYGNMGSAHASVEATLK